MTARFAIHTQTLQQTVLDYFASFDREAVVHINPRLPAALDVELSGQLANRFEGVSRPLPGSPPRRRLRLLFNREYAVVASDYELVAPGSPVLRIMVNDLAVGAPFTRSALLLNIAGDFGDLDAAGVQVRHAAPDVRCRYLPRRYFQLRYLVRLLSYEKTEDVVPVFLDGQTLQALSEARAAQLIDARFGDLGTAAYRKELATGPADPELLRKAVTAGDQAVQEHIRASLEERCADLERQYNEEQQRAVQHFESEFKYATTAVLRQDLDQLKNQKMQELKDRYRVRTEVALLSVQELIAPEVEYTLRVRKGGGFAEVSQPFVLDPLAADDGGGLRTVACSACQEKKVWVYCGLGNHLECGRCGKVEKCHEAGCDGAACAAHTVRCGRCLAVICPAHTRSCQYCPDGTRYCAAHMLKSAEGKAICPKCAKPCTACARIHPAGHLIGCSACQRAFCAEHVAVCPSCKKPHCKDDGGRAEGRAEIYCTGCLARCVECGGQARHLHTDLDRCETCRDPMCTKHARTCVACKKTFCGNHARGTAFGTGCTSCFPSCATCQTPAPAARLVPCAVCPPQGPGRHCAKHACVACGNVVCDRHAVAAPQGQGCVACFGPCVVCRTTYHRKADLVACAECGEGACAVHAVRSQFNNEPYCSPHAQALFAICPGCDRRGPARLFFNCPECKVRYGPCCRIGPPGQPCCHCRGLTPFSEGSGDTLRWVTDAWKKKPPAGVPPVATVEITQSLARGPAGGYSLFLGGSRSHVLVRGEYKGGAFAFLTRYFRDAMRFVVVVDKADLTVRVEVTR
jgi:hypothetical protein